VSQKYKGIGIGNSFQKQYRYWYRQYTFLRKYRYWYCFHKYC